MSYKYRWQVSQSQTHFRFKNTLHVYILQTLRIELSDVFMPQSCHVYVWFQLRSLLTFLFRWCLRYSFVIYADAENWKLICHDKFWCSRVGFLKAVW